MSAGFSRSGSGGSQTDHLPCDRKKAYTSKWEAEEALQRIQRHWKPSREYNTPPKRVYKCVPGCFQYHLTHFGEGQGPFAEMEAKDKAREMAMMQPAVVLPTNEKVDRAVGQRLTPIAPVGREPAPAETQAIPPATTKTHAEKIRESLQRRKAQGLPVGRPRGVVVTKEHRRKITEGMGRAKAEGKSIGGNGNGFKPGHMPSAEAKQKLSAAWTPVRREQLAQDNRDNVAKRKAASESLKNRWDRRRDRVTLGRLYLERLSELSPAEREVMLGLLKPDGLGRQ